jgi:hypothetical protein
MEKKGENIWLHLYMFLKWLSGLLIADNTIRWAEGPLHKSYNWYLPKPLPP